MEQRICKECTYFLQHYTLIDGKLQQAYCGHCTKNAKRRKRPDDKICELFCPGTSVNEKW